MLCVTQFLANLLVLESQVAYLGQVSLCASVEFFLQKLEAGLGLAFFVGGLIVLVKSLDHLLVLALRLLELLLGLFELHGQEFYLLVSHGDILL